MWRGCTEETAKTVKSPDSGSVICAAAHKLNCLAEYEEHQTDGSVSIKVLVRRRVCVGVCVAAVCTARER